MSNAAQITTDSTDTLSAIDAAIAKAKERRAARGADAVSSDTSKTRSKEERDAARKAAAEQRAAAREAKRAAKASAPAKKAHMTKVEKAGSKLPQLALELGDIFKNVTENFTSEQVTALALHLQHFNRVQATTRALTTGELKVGQVVRITGGDPRYIGATGTIETLRRIRVFVAVAGVKKPVYLFTSEVEPVAGGQELPAAEASASTGTNG